MNFDPTQFDNGFEVLALFIIVAGAVAMKWLSTLRKESGETKAQVDKLVATVTENNGGSTQKDQLDRLETALTDHLAWSAEFVKQFDAGTTGTRYTEDTTTKEEV